MGRQKQEKRVSDELIDEILKQGRKPEDVHALLKELTRAVVERAMRAEMNEHLGYVKHDPAGAHSGNSRNGFTRKTLTGEFRGIATGSSSRRSSERTRRGGRDSMTRSCRCTRGG